jgi:Rod binding domain-containing protein
MDRINTEIINQKSLNRDRAREGKRIDNDHRDNADLAVLEEACKDFEAIFLHTLLKTMRKSLPKTEGRGWGRDMYTSIGDLELARSIAHGRGVGLGEVLFEHHKDKVQ